MCLRDGGAKAASVTTKTVAVHAGGGEAKLGAVRGAYELAVRAPVPLNNPLITLEGEGGSSSTVQEIDR